LDLSLVKDVAF